MLGGWRLRADRAIATSRRPIRFQAQLRDIYSAALALVEAGKPRGRSTVNPTTATLRKRTGSSSPRLAAAIINPAMSSRITSGWVVQ
jgi:hypothetical protein